MAVPVLLAIRRRLGRVLMVGLVRAAGARVHALGRRQLVTGNGTGGRVAAHVSIVATATVDYRRQGSFVAALSR